MLLDIVIDVVCPWCYVGKKQLDKALAMRPGIITQKHYRPYQLAPETPVEGVNRKGYYRKKFGENNPQLKAMREHLLKQADTLDISANTLDSHRLIRWADSAGVQDAVVDDLMKRYFEDCAFLGDHALLKDVADNAGMDTGLVTELLSSDKDKAEVTRAIDEARQMGVQGVPMFIFDQKAGVSGAQEADVLVGVIDKLTAEKASV